MTKLYFGGGEIPAFRKVLSMVNSPPISLSYFNLMRNEKRIPDYPGLMLLDSGAMTISKSDAEFDDVYERASEYVSFVKGNIGKVNLIAEFDAQQLTLPVIKQFRSEFYNSLPEDKFLPVWHPSYDKEDLEELCSSYPIVGVTQEDIHGDMSNVPLFNQMISRYGVKLHGVGITSKKILEAVKWTSVSSTAWLSTTRYGELFVWTGRELKRYPTAYKDRAAMTHRTLFRDNGFDYEKIESGDSDELLRLSAWSWQKYIESINGVTTQAANQVGSNSENTRTVVDNLGNSGRTSIPVTVRKTTAIPVVFQDVAVQENDDGDVTYSPVLNIRSESMRICDTCFLKDKCPGFEPNSTCLYNIPIQVKTKQQLKNLKNSLMEIQSQRVLFMKMAEDMSGGYADPNLSSEIDRLERMIKNSQEADTDKFSMTVTASQASRGPSFTEKFFGSTVASKVNELEVPVSADAMILESELADMIEEAGE
jgi:hypothetical protein